MDPMGNDRGRMKNDLKWSIHAPIEKRPAAAANCKRPTVCTSGVPHLVMAQTGRLVEWSLIPHDIPMV